MTHANAANRHDFAAPYATTIRVDPTLHTRDRLSVAFRPILALPHALLVGGPITISVVNIAYEDGDVVPWISGGGALGAVAAVVALIAWFAILFTGAYPSGLYSLAELYLRWRVRAIAYMALLVDEYPPFGEGPYPAELVLAPPRSPRHRASVGFRLILALPHLIAIALFGMAWLVAIVASWVFILFTGRMPAPLHAFGTGMLRWTTRVEGYLLLLYDEYPPFSFS